MGDSALALAQRPPKIGEIIGFQEHRYLCRVGIQAIPDNHINIIEINPTVLYV